MAGQHALIACGYVLLLFSSGHEWNRVGRSRARRAKKNEWFKRGKAGNESVIFVHATPGSELKKVHS